MLATDRQPITHHAILTIAMFVVRSTLTNLAQHILNGLSARKPPHVYGRMEITSALLRTVVSTPLSVNHTAISPFSNLEVCKYIASLACGKLINV